MDKFRKNISEISIYKNTSLIEALKQMDRIDSKLLIVVENNKFNSLLSLGDLQRAIIANKSLDTSICDILRKDIIIANETDPLEQIKQKMLKFRMEFMPVIDKEKYIVKIYFWEDLFTDPFLNNGEMLNIPVVIMAGGKGTRLLPITNVLPKALVPIGDKPIIEKIIDKFILFGVNEFIISVNYKADMIQYYFDSIELKNYKISFIQESKPLGTVGSLSLLSHTMNSTFFLSNCDIIIEQDYRDIYLYHKNSLNEITIVASLKSYQVPYGTVSTGDNGHLISLKEKPVHTYMINTGMYLLEPHVLKEIPLDSFFNFTDLIEKIKRRKGRIGVFPVSEKALLDIGEWQFYQKTFSCLS